MIKRLTTIILTLFLVCATSLANEEHNITLERGADDGITIDLPYGNISFRLVEYGNYHRVLISVENTTISQALLMFRHSMGETELKKNKPKIEFEKTFPGSKGNRSVYSCKVLNQSMLAIVPQEKADLSGIDVSTTSPTKLELPIYLAKYDPKKLIKKGTYNTNYKILSEDILVFNIEVKGWSETDPDYVSTKTAVEEYLRSLKSVAFCKNKKHAPSLSEQQKPYQEKRDSLINVIKTTLQSHQEWFSTDAPYIAYTELFNRLDMVNLNDYNYDCGRHKSQPRQHSCSYCSLSAQEIYHQLDDLYQQLRAGKISKDAAVKKAKALNSCYQSSSKRKKDSFYSGKISGFYNRIVK